MEPKISDQYDNNSDHYSKNSLIIQFIKNIDKGIRELNSAFIFIEKESIEIINDKVDTNYWIKHKRQKREPNEFRILKEDSDWIW